jgi:dihydrofolate synthase/folylpolyglutamate synthase
VETLAEWLAVLETRHPQTIELGLERVGKVRDALALQPDFPVILVAGTNGKGSTCAMLDAILTAQGYRTGLYTSPHLIRYNERVCIKGQESADEDIVATFKRVEAARGDVSLTYFEFATLAAMLQFVESGVDVAILEVGLGGRLDAVNIFEPALSLVTTVDLDHQAWLGPDRESIGREKAGIFRPGVPACCGDSDPPRSLLRRAAELGTPLLRAGVDFSHAKQKDTWAWWDGPGSWPDLPLPALPGAHQLENASLVLAGLRALSVQLPVNESAIHAGLRQAWLPGRMQRLSGRPQLLLDVAHNGESARALARHLLADKVEGQQWAVLGMLADKSIDDLLGPLRGRFAHWFCAGLEGARGQSGQALAEALGQRGVSTTGHRDPLAALSAARDEARENDRIVVFGSFHTVAPILADSATWPSLQMTH